MKLPLFTPLNTAKVLNSQAGCSRFTPQFRQQVSAAIAQIKSNKN
jgi:hypothetical protein